MTSLAPRTRSTGRRRISPLSVLEALATPHGIDRYLELVNPMLTVRDLRAEVTEVHRSTADTRHADPAPDPPVAGLRGRPVRLDQRRDRRRAAHPLLLARVLATARRRPHRTHRSRPTRRVCVSQYLHANAAPGLVVGLTQADGTFRLPHVRPAKVLLVSGGSGITPVHVDAAHAVRRGLHRRRHVPALRDTPRTTCAYRAELDALAAAHANVRVVLAYTDQETGGDLHGFFGQAHLDAAAPWHADAETFLCGPPALMRSVREPVRRDRPRCTAAHRGLRPVTDRDRRRRRRRRRHVHVQCGHRAQHRPEPARTGRGRRAHARVRLPDGHLLHLHPGQGVRLHPQPAHRRTQQRPGRLDPTLHLSSRRRRRRQPLSTDPAKSGVSR